MQKILSITSQLPKMQELKLKMKCFQRMFDLYKQNSVGNFAHHVFFGSHFRLCKNWTPMHCSCAVFNSITNARPGGVETHPTFLSNVCHAGPRFPVGRTPTTHTLIFTLTYSMRFGMS